MPRLILLNGPPACGKSTLAQRYADEHPMTLNLDIDRVRGLIGRWREDPHLAGLTARAISLAAARVHLHLGYDVVVPQFVARLDFLRQLEALAGEVGADFHEIVLLDSKENALRRFADRAAADDVDVDELAAMYDRLVDLLTTRTAAKVVPTEAGRVDDAYRLLLACLS